MPDSSYLVKTMIGFKIAHINIQSLLPKFDELVSLLHYISLDVLCVTETWLNENVTNNEIEINGYSLYRKDWPKCRGRGLCIYVKSDTPVIDTLNVNEVELLVLEIKPKHLSPICICAVYRHPGERVEYISNLTNVLEYVFDKYSNFVLLGDLNIDLKASDDHGRIRKNRSINDMCNILVLEQLIGDYTRVTCRSKTLIEHQCRL